MSGFSADWLRLREPFDTQARDSAAGELGLAGWAAALHWHNDEQPLQVIDLGCGLGANRRYLRPRLGGNQRWLVVDHDAALLQAWPPDADVQFRQLDLARDLAALPWTGTQLVTASALLDLVSAAWLAALIGHARAAGSALLFALSVDGRLAWDPADPDDARVAGLFEAHQQRDKGFGPALGTAAPDEAQRLLAQAGYLVREARSDWRIAGAEDPAMLAALLDGMAAAATEQQPAQRAAIEAWRQRRQALAGRSVLRVGHRDISARLP